MRPLPRARPSRRTRRHPAGLALAGLLAGIAALAGVGSGTGCTSSTIAAEELPSQPVAFLHWEPEDARRRLELLEGESDEGPRRLGVASAAGLGSLIGLDKDEGAVHDQLARWPGRLTLVDPRTGRLERVKAAPPGARPLAWSPDRERLMFASAHQTGTVQLYEWNRKTGDVIRLTHGDEIHAIGDYGPDGALTYSGVRRVGNAFRLRVYLDGAGRQRPEVLREGRVYYALRYAPHGQSLLLVRPDASGPVSGPRVRPPELVSLPLAGGEERPLSRGKDPVFGPRGDVIVFAAPVGGGWRLARMRPDGSGRTLLGKAIRDENSPSISPDGSHVVYVGREGEFDRLFVRRMDGTGHRLLFDNGAAAWPVW